MSGILVYSEAEETTLGLLTKGRELSAALGRPLSAALLGSEADQHVEACFRHGAVKVYLGDALDLTPFQAGIYAEALAQILAQAEADVILIGATRRGRELAPRLAQKLQSGCVTDAVNLSHRDGQLVVERRALGGNTVSARVVKSPRQVISVMPNLYEADPGSTSEGEVIPVSLELEPGSMRIVEHRPKEVGLANLEEAEVLVCVGRGLKDEGDLSLIQILADALGGMVGCTRPISHEYNWLMEDQMIGLSGKEIRPRLYVAIGVSGQIQHTVGIMGAKTIVAVNRDQSAPILKIADYGIVGDLYQVVPKLIDQIKAEFGG